MDLLKSIKYNSIRYNKDWSETPIHSFFQFVQYIVYYDDYDLFIKHERLMSWARQNWKEFK